MPLRFLLPLIFCFAQISLFAQLSGQVLDENGDPLPFASVYVQNSTKGVTANANGEFRLPLDPGSYDIVFHYIGYELHVEQVVIKAGVPTKLKVRLNPSVMEIGEVVITGEDPAIRIMKEAISRRAYYRHCIPDYHCDVYIKGFHKLIDAPTKILGQEIGNMGGMLDSTGSGVLYLAESVSTVYVQAQPPKTKEVMISSKVSGNDNGFNINRSTLTDFNLYDEHLDIERQILSPLADNAFSWYNFHLEGSFQDGNGNKIYKIAVMPKRPADPTFSGVLYIVDNYYNLSGVNLTLTGDAIKQPVLDTLRITQEFVPVESPDKWCLLSQVTTFKFGILGFKIRGTFNSVFSNYDIHPKYDDNFFNKEEFRIEQTAGKKDSAYWAQVRPVPLTAEESRDYVVKDSLRAIWESKPFLDSMDRKSNRFKPLDLLTGYSWNNSYKKITLDWPASYNWVQFNTVQGLLVNIKPTYSKFDGDHRTKFYKIEGLINYGFSEHHWRGGLKALRHFDSIYNTELEVEGGLETAQFDGRQPIPTLVNSIYTLFLRENYLKLYETAFGRVTFRRTLAPGFRLQGSLEYDDRRPLTNHSDFSWYKKTDRAFTLNGPVYSGAPFEPYFDRNQALLLDVQGTFRFGVTYSTYPGMRLYSASKWPVLNVGLTQAIPTGTDNANFLKARVGVSMSNWSWGLVGYSDWNVTAGGFIYRKNASFIDAYHPMGNQTAISDPKRAMSTFMSMPYYVNSTYSNYLEAHWQHHFQGYLLDKVPGLRKLNWKEVLTFNGFYTDKHAVEQNAESKPAPWLEAGFGFENIGIKFFRPVHVDVIGSFEGREYRGVRVLVGVDL